jgi:hypothetical protein
MRKRSKIDALDVICVTTMSLNETGWNRLKDDLLFNVRSFFLREDLEAPYELTLERIQEAVSGLELTEEADPNYFHFIWQTYIKDTVELHFLYDYRATGTQTASMLWIRSSESTDLLALLAILPGALTDPRRVTLSCVLSPTVWSHFGSGISNITTITLNELMDALAE